MSEQSFESLTNPSPEKLIEMAVEGLRTVLSAMSTNPNFPQDIHDAIVVGRRNAEALTIEGKPHIPKSWHIMPLVREIMQNAAAVEQSQPQGDNS